MAVECWHAETDTLPRIQRSGGPTSGRVDLVLPVGVYSDAGEPVRVHVDAERLGADGPRPWRHRSLRQVTAAWIATLAQQDRRRRGEPGPSALRSYLDMREQLANHPDNSYYEVVLRDLDEGAQVAYRFVVTLGDRTQVGLGPFRLYLTAPRFGRGDLVAGSVEGGEEGWWIAYLRRDGPFDHVRVDLLTTVHDGEGRFDRPRLELTLNDVHFDVGGQAPQDMAWLPLIDRSADSVTVPWPRDERGPLDHLEVNGVPVALDGACGTARLVLTNFCNQALNDLFASPNTSYRPPRTYMQVTMRDERAAFSSRPDSPENQIVDGYALTLDAQRYYGIPSLWAFSAGVLVMIAHDCPDELAKLRRDAASGLVTPIIAGFGTHRTPYYRMETNLAEIELGRTVLANLFGNAPGSVYYPDQRLYEGRPGEREALRGAAVEYLVFDRSTTYDLLEYWGQARPLPEGNHLWRDDGTGCLLLLIDDQVRNQLVGQSADEVDRGKLPYDLRRLFMRAAVSLPDNLYVYGDDADKASGNGWFDGEYTKPGIDFNAKYQATLDWLSRHPWTEVLDFAALRALRPAGAFTVRNATCPSVDPDGDRSVDCTLQRNHMHFDAWYDWWRQFPACWVGGTLGELSDWMEAAIHEWPENLRGPLWELALTYFLMFCHESQWNKQPLERGNPNDRVEPIEPEDFVIAESLQLRNANVLLNAAIWAAWARRARTERTWVDEGPVVRRAATVAAGLPTRDAATADGLHWDLDPMANVIVYNRHALVVLDRNGGRATHLFVMAGGRPYSLSGTCKSFQYLVPDRRDPGGGIVCDGEVIQNTVYTANHAYLACDVAQAQGVRGVKFDPRPGVERDEPCLYPDNFNEYECRVEGGAVVFTYGPGEPPPPDLDLDKFRRLCERDRRVRNGEGVGDERTVVWHDQRWGRFSKRIQLVGRTLHVRYRDAPARHVVANEFCLDPYRGIMRAEFQSKEIGPGRRSVLLTNPAGLEVTVRLGDGCRFTDATLLTHFADAVARDLAVGYLRLHRVLTDNLEIECPDGGTFDYRIEL